MFTWLMVLEAGKFESMVLASGNGLHAMSQPVGRASQRVRDRKMQPKLYFCKEPTFLMTNPPYK